MERLLTVEEAAPSLNMSRQAAYAAIRAGQIPALRIGRRIRLDPRAVRTWIESQTGPKTKTQTQAESVTTAA